MRYQQNTSASAVCFAESARSHLSPFLLLYRRGRIKKLLLVIYLALGYFSNSLAFTIAPVPNVTNYGQGNWYSDGYGRVYGSAQQGAQEVCHFYYGSSFSRWLGVSGLNATFACIDTYGHEVVTNFFTLQASCNLPSDFQQYDFAPSTTFFNPQCQRTTYTCPGGFTLTGGMCVSNGDPAEPSNQGESCPKEGNPINPATGNKFQLDIDYSSGGPQPLIFRGFYNGRPPLQIGEESYPLGAAWRHFFQRSIAYTHAPPRYTAFVKREDGRVLMFSTTVDDYFSSYVPAANVSGRLEVLSDGAGNPTGWKYTTEDNSVELYDNYHLVSISDARGLTQTLAYDEKNQLSSVTDSAGRKLQFTYDALHRIRTMTDPAGGVYTYAYDAVGNLSSVQHPDTHTKTYVYNEPAYTSGANLPNALTGIVDENGVRYATYQYDAQGRAISSEHAGSAEKVSLNYTVDPNTNNGNGTTIVTDALGTSRTYNFQTILGVVKSTGQSQPGGSGCAAAGSSIGYDANGNVASRTDFNGIQTTYSYDLSRNLETSRTEAYGTPQVRTIGTQWHPTFRLPTKITEPGRVTDFSYDPASGNLLTKTITDSATGESRTTSYSYTSAADGTLPNLIKTLDGPRTDVADITTYSYYPNGDLQTITNALGHVTQITQYDGNGRPLSLTDPNGLTTTLSYTPRGWLKTRSLGSETTTYHYDNVGQLIGVDLPNGQSTVYSYDSAHRLTDIQDNLNNRIHYTLDPMGNRTREDTYDATNTLVATRSRTFDALNRLYQDIGAINQTTTYQYDANGNLKTIADPLTGSDAQNHSTRYQYDALNRLSQVTDALNGTTGYTYNALDQLKNISDPRALNTVYSVNAFGEHTSEQSPDTGLTQYTYDAAGNLKTRKDAKNQTTTYQYDALNRLTLITYHDGTQALYSYDQGTNAVGRLTQLQDTSGTTSYQYDTQGRLIQKTQGADSIAYSYDAATGNLSKLTYPDNTQVSYGYNQGRITSLSVNGVALLTNIQYQPFGPIKAWTFGNSQAYSRSYNSDNRIQSYTLGTTIKTLSYDAAGRIKGISDPTVPQTLDYDPLNRLTSYAIPSLNQGYQYDANGNRTKLTIGTQSYSYAINPTNNQLQSTQGPSPQNYQYDANGSILNDTLRSYSYDVRGRLINANNTNYVHNALGQRIKKSTSSATTRFMYDEAGKLLYETDGTSVKSYIYLDDMPVAVRQ